MKLTEANLQEFLAALPDYEHLSVSGRRALAEMGSQSVSMDDLKENFWRLVEARFVVAPNFSRHGKVAPGRQDFLRVLRTLHAHPVFQAPTKTAFEAYLNDHLTSQESQAFFARPPAHGQDRDALFEQMTAPDWVEGFLAAKNAGWEESYVRPGLHPMLSGSGIFGTAQSLVRFALERGAPVPLRELPAYWTDGKSLSLALCAAVRYGLLFMALNPASMEPLVGLWPSVIGSLAKPEWPPPQPTRPSETLDGSFLMEDITALLIACVSQPMRLRSTDGKPFAKTVRDLAANMHPLPKWIESRFDYDSEMRMEVAFAYTNTFQLAESQGGSAPELSVTERGRKWLALDAGERLRVLVDGVWDRKQIVPGFEKFEGAKIGAVAPRVHIATRLPSTPEVDLGLLESFSSLGADDFFPLSQILTHARAQRNPLLEMVRRDKSMRVYVGNRYFDHADVDTLQSAWAMALESFIRIRLLPFGCVRLGNGEGGISVAITPVGRYYLGQTKEWKWSAKTDSQVIVQPNFEVTFLGASPSAEAEIGRFAERRGQKLGALFQITKKSIYAAAAAGINAEAVLKTLQTVCTREVPGNVRREIEGWFAQIRRVSLESTMLIRCPDRETAARVMAAAKTNVTALNETVLEFRNAGAARSALLKKLKEMGVLVDVSGVKTPPSPTHRGGPRYIRRGRW